jgi:hypothetical protein
MTDWAAILERAFGNDTKTRGDSGNTGDRGCKLRITNENSSNALVTIDCPPLVTLEPPAAVVTTVTTAGINDGDGPEQKNPPLIQRPPEAVTSVTTVSTFSKPQEENPLAGLRALTAPDDFSMWLQILKDADRFCSSRLEEARSLGWSDTDLFGVHPLAPAARFDAMGLVLLIRGGDVLSLDCKHARLKTVGGSSLVFRKPRNPYAVPVWGLAT